MTVTAQIVGSRIAEARGRRGLTQEQLAQAAGLDRTALNKVEHGSRKVSALELSALAVELHERIEWFVTDAPAAVVAHRDSREPGSETSVIDDFIDRLSRNVEFVDRLDGAAPAGPGPALASPRTLEDAERLASEVRQMMNCDKTSPLTDLPSLTYRIGLLAFSADLGPDTADAGSVMLDHNGVAVVNSHAKVGRRRLALAHELGHFLVADSYVVDWRIAEQHQPQATEAQLDRFARALLAPRQSISDAWTDNRSREDLRTSAVRVASHFQIDMATLARRVIELDLESADTARSIRGYSTNRADIVEHDLLVPVDLEKATLPREFEKRVLRLYKNRRISGERAVDLLLETIDIDALPSPPTRNESEIWQYVS